MLRDQTDMSGTEGQRRFQCSTRSLRRLGLCLALLASGGCSANVPSGSDETARAAGPANLDSASAKKISDGEREEMIVHARHAGFYVHSENRLGILTGGPSVIRDQRTFERFLSGVPDERIQKRQPAPPNDDSILKLTPDFDRHMILVAYRVDIMSFNIHFEDIQKDGETLRAVNANRFRFLGLLPGCAVLRGSAEKENDLEALSAKFDRTLSENTLRASFERPKIAFGPLVFEAGPASVVRLDTTYLDDRVLTTARKNNESRSIEDEHSFVGC